MDARESVRNLVEDLLESRRGAAGILQARGQSIAQRATRQQKTTFTPSKRLPSSTNLSQMFGINVQQPTSSSPAGQQAKQTLATSGLKKSTIKGASNYLGLQHLQARARHKGSTPSNKPSWGAAKYLGKKALSYHSPIGLGITAGLDALVPGLGLVSRSIQQAFGDQMIEAVDRSPFGLSNHNVRDWARQQIDHSASRADWKNLPSAFEHDAVKSVFSKVKNHMNKASIKHRVNASKATTHSELRSALEFE
jgi:hypothetical protein